MLISNEDGEIVTYISINMWGKAWYYLLYIKPDITYMYIKPDIAYMYIKPDITYMCIKSFIAFTLLPLAFQAHQK